MGNSHCPVRKAVHSVQRFRIYSRTGVSNPLPAGKKQPAKGFFPAREMISGNIENVAMPGPKRPLYFSGSPLVNSPAYTQDKPVEFGEFPDPL